MTHFLQSKYWWECKRRIGGEIYEIEGMFYQITKLPFGLKIAYAPRVSLLDQKFSKLVEDAKSKGVIFLKVDPLDLNLGDDYRNVANYQIRPTDAINSKQTVLIEIGGSMEKVYEDFDKMHKYSIRVAEKRGVKIDFNETENDLQDFINLYESTAKRQKYHARSASYVTTVWDTLKEFEKKEDKTKIILANARVEGKLIASAMFFVHEDTIYYAYSGSSADNKNYNGNYALICRVIEWGNENGYKYLDLMGINPAYKDDKGNMVYDGYSKFKLGWSQNIVTYADSVNIVFKNFLYAPINILMNLRSLILFRHK